MEKFYRQLIWSFEALWLGFEPVKDWAGKPIAGAKRNVKLMGDKFMTLWSLICDLEHCAKAYGMPSAYGICPCGLCPVNSSDIPWWDFRPNALWLPRIYTKAQWVAAGLQNSFIFFIVGVSCLSFYPDWMHCKSLGIDKPLAGFLYWGSSAMEAFLKQSLNQSLKYVRLYGKIGL